MNDWHPVHLSALFLKHCNKAGLTVDGEPYSEELLRSFAGLHGMSVDELESSFLEEELDHHEQRCTMAGCVREFGRSRASAKATEVIGRCSQEGRIVFHVPEGSVAPAAEQTPDEARGMIVIPRQGCALDGGFLQIAQTSCLVPKSGGVVRNGQAVPAESVALGRYARSRSRFRILHSKISIWCSSLYFFLDAFRFSGFMARQRRTRSVLFFMLLFPLVSL